MNAPVTRRELREELAALMTEIRAEFATKADLQQLRTEVAARFAEMREYVDFSAKSLRDELRAHFDVVAESFRSEFRNDWTLATTTSLAARVDALEKREASRRDQQ